MVVVTCIFFVIEIAGFPDFVADVCSKRKLKDWGLFYLNHHMWRHTMA